MLVNGIDLNQWNKRLQERQPSEVVPLARLEWPAWVPLEKGKKHRLLRVVGDTVECKCTAQISVSFSPCTDVNCLKSRYHRCVRQEPEIPLSPVVTWLRHIGIVSPGKVR